MQAANFHAAHQKVPIVSGKRSQELLSQRAPPACVICEMLGSLLVVANHLTLEKMGKYMRENSRTPYSKSSHIKNTSLGFLHSQKKWCGEWLSISTIRSAPHLYSNVL